LRGRFRPGQRRPEPQVVTRVRWAGVGRLETGDGY
jgi:hypothetical protein